MPGGLRAVLPKVAHIAALVQPALAEAQRHFIPEHDHAVGRRLHARIAH
jgi:hypothetical protein